MSADRRAAIVGLGLIGGSFAAALRVARPRWSIVGFDVNEEARARVADKRFVDRLAFTADEALRAADVIVLATPVSVILEILGRLARVTAGDAIVLDVGSTKSAIVDAMNGLPERLQAVGGHPMTGALTTGSNHPNARLFAGQRFVLTPARQTTRATVEAVEGLLRDFRADPVVMDPSRHDRAVAVMSHLPYLMSLPLLDVFAEQDEVTRSLAAGGFKSRVEGANLNPVMWRDILLTNRAEILRALRIYRDQLAALERDLNEASAERLAERLERAGGIARSLSARP
jgi:prephenate dehydrogenase